MERLLRAVSFGMIVAALAPARALACAGDPCAEQFGCLAVGNLEMLDHIPGLSGVLTGINDQGVMLTRNTVVTKAWRACPRWSFPTTCAASSA